MKKICLALIFLCVIARGEDNDTIPLSKTTTPTRGGEVSESLLLAPPTTKKKKPGANAQPQHHAKAPAPDMPYIASFDTFGSSRISERQVREFLGKDLQVWFDKGVKSDPTSLEMEATFKKKIRDKWNFAMVEFSIIPYFEAGDKPIFVTIDVVEPKDVETRMPFGPPPTAQLGDPDKLLANWLEYETLALDLVERGELEPQLQGCVALHCPFGHAHPKLKKYEKIFSEGVKKHEADLVEISKNDASPDNRASAVYLLAYLKDGNKVVKYMLDRIRDPHDLVRNNSLRVLGDIAEKHHDYLVPVAKILEALHFPRVTDRSKAAYVIYHAISDSRQARDEVLSKAVTDLLKMLDSKQPDHVELAHGVLSKVSGKDFAASDTRAWAAWARKLASDIVKK